PVIFTLSLHDALPILPMIGTVTGIGGEWDTDRLAVGYTSFTQPPCVYRVDPTTGAIVMLAQGTAPPDFDTSKYLVRQEWYTSREDRKSTRLNSSHLGI